MLLKLIAMSLLLAACAGEPTADSADRSTAYAVAIGEVCGGPCPSSMAITLDWNDVAAKAAIEEQLGRSVSIGIPHNQQIDWVGVSEARLSANRRALIVRVELVRGPDYRQDDILLVPDGDGWRVATPGEVDVTTSSTSS